MSRYLIELRSLCDWQSRLGDPVMHWKRGASAMELAIQWTLASVANGSGLPAKVEEILNPVIGGTHPRVKLAVPELQTPLAGKGKPSQTDLWVLLDTNHGFVSVSVEGKARETFGELIASWIDVEKNHERWIRLRYLCSLLGIDPEGALVRSLRYQLLHRTVAAIKEAQEWKASAAVMMVQCFAHESREARHSWDDFRGLCVMLGADAERNRLSKAMGIPGSMPLWLGWLDCEPASDANTLAVLGQSRSALRAVLVRNSGRGEAESPENGDGAD